MREAEIFDETGPLITLNTTTQPKLLDWTPTAPELDTTEIEQAADGGEQPLALWRNVEERSIVVQYDTFAAARTDLQLINRALETARRRQASGAGARAWLRYRHYNGEPVNRSEILSGVARLANDVGTQIEINLTRRFYWEDALESTALLQNPGSGGNVSTITLQNHAAGSAYNYATILAANVQGEIPTPARLELYNSYNNANVVPQFRVGRRVGATTGFSHVLQAEACTLAGGAAVVGSAGASNGQYVNMALQASNNAQAQLQGTLSSAFLAACGGQWFKILLFPGGTPSHNDARIRAAIKLSVITIWQGDWVAGPLSGSAILDLGTVQLPGVNIAGGDYYPLTLEITTKHATAAVGTYPVDYIMFMPLESYRVLNCSSFGTAYQVTLHDVPHTNEAYTVGWSGGPNKAPNVTALGDPIMLTPGQINTLYVMADQPDAVARTTQLTVRYRPRRLTV